MPARKKTAKSATFDSTVHLGLEISLTYRQGQRAWGARCERAQRARRGTRKAVHAKQAIRENFYKVLLPRPVSNRPVA